MFANPCPTFDIVHHLSTNRQPPPEVIDIILDHLFHDKKELGVCSLVCKAWLPTTRYHLFADIKVIIEVTAVTVDTVGPLFRLLNSPHCTIRYHIRHLCLRGPCDNLDQRYRAEISYLRYLPGIQSLHIDNVDWEVIDGYSKAVLLHLFPRLVLLSLSRTSFQSFSNVLDVIDACPRLQSLSLGNGVQWSQKCPLTAVTSRPLPRLQNLALADTSKVFILRSLYLPEMYINTLDLQSITFQQRPMIDRVLIATASTLEHLTLDFARPGQVHSAHGLSLSPCVKLRALGFGRSSMYTEYSADKPLNVVREVLNILSSVRANDMEEVKFQLWLLNSVDELEAFDWAAADEVFRHSAFSRMKRIHFTIYGIPRSCAVFPADWIGKRMPECFARGILRFECTKPSSS